MLPIATAVSYPCSAYIMISPGCSCRSEASLFWELQFPLQHCIFKYIIYPVLANSAGRIWHSFNLPMFECWGTSCQSCINANFLYSWQNFAFTVVGKALLVLPSPGGWGEKGHTNKTARKERQGVWHPTCWVAPLIPTEYLLP